MRILVDENIPRMTVDRLRELGHDVKDIRGTGDKGLADADLWDLAVRERRLLITTDKGSRSIAPPATAAFSSFGCASQTA
jgi:predicted nuclease of predicted toxin-antitoxin system